MAWTGRLMKQFPNDRKQANNAIRGGTSQEYKDRDSSSPESGLSKIENVHEGFTNWKVAGIIISKESPRCIISKNSNSQRYVMNFVLRDSPGGFVNVTCWGGEDYTRSLYNNFGIGDVVQLSNFIVQPKTTDGNDDRFKPSTPLPFNFSMSESQSSLCLYGGWDRDSFDSLLRLPTKVINDFYTLEDILANAQSLEKESVNLSVVVKKVGQAKEFTTKGGKKMARCEIRIFDDTCPSFAIIVWSKEHCEMAATWMSFETVLFIADVRVSYDSFRSSMVASANSKTIFTVNPDTAVGYSLYQFAQSQKQLKDDEREQNTDPPYPPTGGTTTAKSLSQMVFPFDKLLFQNHSLQTERQIEDIRVIWGLETISDLYHIQTIKTKMAELEMKPMNASVYGLMMCYLSQFDIDSDVNSVVRFRCEKCLQTVHEENRYTCSNSECANGALCLFDPSMQNQKCAMEYSIQANFTDDTGTLEHCYLNNTIAESMIGYQANVFDSLDLSQKTALKWKYLLERVKVYFKLVRGSFDGPVKINLKVLYCSLANPKDL